jgi:hypothetical protein
MTVDFLFILGCLNNSEIMGDECAMQYDHMPNYIHNCVYLLPLHCLSEEPATKDSRRFPDCGPNLFLYSFVLRRDALQCVSTGSFIYQPTAESKRLRLIGTQFHVSGAGSVVSKSC